MKKLSRKLFIACLAVAFAVIALGTSTYAWLVVSRTASVDPFEGSVKAGDGSIEVSIDDTNWKTSITSDDFTNLKSANFVSFNDVTYNDDKFKKFAIDSVKKSASLTDIGTLAYDKDILGTAGILKFEFSVRLAQDSSKDTEELYLDLSNSLITEGAGNNSSWTPDKTVGDDIKQGTATEKFKVSNAARVMVKLGTNTAVILEKGAGQNDNTAGLQTKNDETGAMGYLKARTEIASTNIPDSTNYTTQAINGTADIKLGTVSKTATKVTVIVWLEGYDYDCINALYKQILSVKLGLTLGEN